MATNIKNFPETTDKPQKVLQTLNANRPTSQKKRMTADAATAFPSLSERCENGFPVDSEADFWGEKRALEKIFLRKGLFIKKQYFNFAPQFAKETIKKIKTI